jgi:hypothetical protein
VPGRKGDVSKRQTTRWLFSRRFSNAVIRAGIVHNAAGARTPRDVVRLLFMMDGEELADWYMMPNEALALGLGLFAVIEKIAFDAELTRQKKGRLTYISRVIRASQKTGKAT